MRGNAAERVLRKRRVEDDPPAFAVLPDQPEIMRCPHAQAAGFHLRKLHHAAEDRTALVHSAVHDADPVDEATGGAELEHCRGAGHPFPSTVT